MIKHCVLKRKNMTHELENIEKLDEEFKAHIKEIQLYFKTFKWTNYELRLCRAWLYKLFNTDRCQILLRNAYLDKLMKQLLIGELNHPFNKFPRDNEPLIPLSTYLPINFNGCYDETKNTQVHTLVSDMLNFPMTVVVHKYTGNQENYNAHIIKEIKTEESSNSKQIPNIIDISDTSKEIQEQKTTADNNEGGDILILNHETKMKSDTIEQVYEELKIKNEILADQVQLYVDRNKLHDDCLIMIRDELSKVKNDVDQIKKWKATKEVEDFDNFKMFIDKTTDIDNRISQVILEVNDLKTAVKDERENKKCMNDMIELLKYMKEQHSLQITEKQRHINEQTNKLEDDIEQLKANVNIKNKEVNSLEELVIIQNVSIDYYKKSLKEFLLLALDK